MTDTHKSAVPELAQDVLQDSAMDQALEWLKASSSYKDAKGEYKPRPQTRFQATYPSA